MAPVVSRDYVISGIYYSVLVRNTCQQSQQTRHWPNAGPMLAHNLRRWHCFNASCLLGAAFNPVNTKHYCYVSFVECFRMFWKSKKLQVRDYLFEWTEFFRIKSVRSWVVGLPYHPQLRNYVWRSELWFFLHYSVFWRVADWTNVDPMFF